MNKRIIPAVLVGLFFAYTAAVTQETPIRISEPAPAAPARRNVLSSSLRWFRSNRGGMALEEIPSGITALRSEYALSVGPSRREELPQMLLEFYNNGFNIEVRSLYENGEIIRTQWIFKDARGTTRVNAVFSPAAESEENPDSNESIAGFIEIFNAASFLITEYRFSDNGRRNRTDYNFSNNILISSTVYTWEENDEGGEYREAYADLFRYNRSQYLRSIERVFFTNRQISLMNEPVVVSFPIRRMDFEDAGNLTGEMIHAYPEFFGEIQPDKNEKIVYVTDERSRILSQTYYDDEDNIIWIIRNTWYNDRIASTVKIEGETEFLAEFEYNSQGEKILERNYKNGDLERLVRAEGKTEIEELYLNGNVVLRAVWEDGRKVSETRTGSR